MDNPLKTTFVTEAKRDEYFLHKLATHRSSNADPITGIAALKDDDDNQSMLDKYAHIGRFSIGAAVETELTRLDPTRTGLISVALRTKCKEQGITLEHQGLTIGTVIHGLDLAHVSDAAITTIHEILLERKVVFFRNQQHLTKEQHVQFGRRFGTLEIHPFSQPVQDFPHILRIKNDKHRPASINVWHSDVTWRTKPSLGSILLMRKKPKFGGDTLFCDSHCQFDGLAQELKDKIQGLTAVHDFKGFRRAQRRLGVPQQIIDEMRTHFPQASHPVVRTHPNTGKQSLYVSQNFTEHIQGVSAEESARILKVLYAQCRVPEYQCRFQWEEGSIAFWDNRACQHYASADYYPDSRVVERVTVCGGVPFFHKKESSKL